MKSSPAFLKSNDIHAIFVSQKRNERIDSMKWCLDLLRLSVVFRFVYSTWWQRAWMAFCVISVGVSCAAVWQCGFTATPESPISIKILTPVSTVFSIASLCVTFFGFLWSNRTHKMILPNCGFLKIWQDRIKSILDLVHISQTQTDAGYAKISIGTDGDFSVESIEIDKYLKNGGSISFQIFPRRRSNLWRRINKHLAECVLKLSMKQAACGHKGFFNEGKVAMISPLAMRFNDDLQNKDSAEKSLCISVVKTDYYTSYLTNEAYRDPVVDELHSGSMQIDEEWVPFDSDGDNWILKDLEDWNSMHVGVNTLGITKDNILCLWTQINGQHSQGLIAPTGSGSMDWKDLKLLIRKNGWRRGRGDFLEVIKYAAERELKEESFDKDGLEKLKQQKADMHTKIIGFYRWGKRGGLPGFICITSMPVNYRDMGITERIDEVSHSMFNPIQLKGSEGNRREDLKIIGERLKGKQLSLPLVVCLRKLESEWGSPGDLDEILN